MIEVFSLTEAIEIFNSSQEESITFALPNDGTIILQRNKEKIKTRRTEDILEAWI